MKILNISIDKDILKRDSAVAQRMVWFGGVVDKYTIIVPCDEKKEVALSDSVFSLGSGGKNKIMQFFTMFRLVQQLLKKEKYSVITTQDPYFTGLLGVLLAKKNDVGVEVQVHGWNKETFFRNALRNWTIRHANGVRVVSKRMKQKVQDLGVTAEKITVVPIYTDVQVQKDSTKKMAPGKRRFITVSRLVPVKNIVLQLHAFAGLGKELDWSLDIVGDGPEKDMLEKKVKELGLEEYVSFLGWCDGQDLVRVYNSADCLLLTSNSEGWGRVIIEAGSYGVPTIMTDVGLAGEVVKNEENGIVVAINNTSALRSAIERVILDSDYLQKLSAGIVETVRYLPTKKYVLEKYVDGWKKAIT
ncbi:MAG: hypothetical protein CL685_03900 [Candidatus Magasanikbacteria bacterium]|nr:hypothetical protein [Candidatus Magasanikbacteria bacterium]